MSKRRIFLLIGLLIVGAIELRNFFSSSDYPSGPLEIPKEATATARKQEGEAAVVRRVIDGDTVDLLDGRRVRYIGIDAPELAHEGAQEECFAQESYDANKQYVEGKSVRLLKDTSETDTYGRLLRYVYVDNFMVNDRLVQEGFARAWNVSPDEHYKQVFFDSHLQAQSSGKGLWQLCKK